ncbi:MAG: hypothetical protein KCHDKBKB_00712 [Elusimicrobia bacterium]|nr:hypothetical protein [Elusimicrobiota bacterium]
MTFICLQAGHEGRTSGSTGAPGEIELNVRIRNRLSEILQSKGFVIQLVAADPPDSEINKDFDLFLSLHGDADIYKGVGGGCVGSGDKSVDLMWQRSAEIRDAIIAEYFTHSGIEHHPERVNVNMTKYYMWSRLSPKTPCVLIEQGVVQNPHDKVILADTNIVANAIARGVCRAFNVPFDPPAPTPNNPPTTPTVFSDPNTQVDMGDKWGVMSLGDARKWLNDMTYKLGVCESKPPVIKEVPVEVIKEVIKEVPKEVYINDPVRQQIKDIFSGGGWWWVKYAKIKSLIG